MNGFIKIVYIVIGGNQMSKLSEKNVFENKLSEKVVGIAAVTGFTGIGAGRAERDIMWNASINLIAWKDLSKSEPAIKKELRLEWLIEDGEWENSKNILEKNSIVRLLVRMGEKTMMLVMVLETVYRDADLALVLKDSLKPVYYIDEMLGEFELNKGVKLFEKRISWAGEEGSLYFDWNEDTTVMKSALKTAYELFKEQDEWSMKIKMYASEELLESANEWLQDKEDDDIDEITRETFIEYLGLDSMSVFPEGNFEIFFFDGDIILSVKKIYRKKAIKGLTIILILLFIGALWQYAMSCYEGKRYAPPGRLIDVKNHKMHIYAKGEGPQTVVLTVGSGTPCAYTDYYYIQNELSEITRTVIYNRPGFGWSEPTSVPRTIDEQVNDLHDLLNKSGEKPPYILVGHSLASLEVIHYAQLFPEEVAGIVLIDGGSPEYYADYNESAALALNFLFEGIRKSGLLRAIGSVNENARKVIKGGKLGDIPLVILTSGQDEKWKASQAELKYWSDNSKHENIPEASHYIHWSNPDIVIDKIRELIKSSQ